MKKVYTRMAAALASVSMMAAPFQPVNSPKIEKDVAAPATMLARGLDDAKIIKTKAPATPDLNNYMGYNYVGRSNSDGGMNYVAVELQQISATEVMIYGLFYNFGVKATYNASAQTLTINGNQQILSAEDWNGEEPLMLYIYQFTVEDGMITAETEVNSLVLTYAPDGVEFSDGSVDYIGGWYPDSPYKQLTFVIPSIKGTNSGYAYSWHYNNFFYPLGDLYPEAPAFTFDASEWTNVGESQFFDGWFGGAGEEYDPQYNRSVVTYRNNENPAQFLLENPFGPGSLAVEFGYNETPDNTGYVFIDATDPECVLVRPAVLSGVSNEYLFGSSSILDVTNYEGIQYYFYEMDTEDIIDEANAWGDDLSNMTEDGLITIYRGRFGYVPWLDDENYWIVGNGDSTPIDMISRIQLPAGALGVHGIMDDASNAPVKYYNLQGMEISNPENGQLVIKKQGSNSVKMIAK